MSTSSSPTPRTTSDPEPRSRATESPPASDDLAASTVREREILALLALGLSDRGVAESPSLTAKTAETHNRHILSKLSLPATTSTTAE